MGGSTEAASSLLLHSRSHQPASLERREVGQLALGPARWAMQRGPKQPTEMAFLSISLVFPDHVQGRILQAASSASLQKRLTSHS